MSLSKPFSPLYFNYYKQSSSTLLYVDRSIKYSNTLKYKQNRKLITIKCDCCGKEFEKPLSEYNRNIKLGRANYCSRACSGKMCNKNNKQKGNPSSLKPHNVS